MNNNNQYSQLVNQFMQNQTPPIQQRQIAAVRPIPAPHPAPAPVMRPEPRAAPTQIIRPVAHPAPAPVMRPVPAPIQQNYGQFQAHYQPPVQQLDYAAYLQQPPLLHQYNPMAMMPIVPTFPMTISTENLMAILRLSLTPLDVAQWLLYYNTQMWFNYFMISHSRMLMNSAAPPAPAQHVQPVEQVEPVEQVQPEQQVLPIRPQPLYVLQSARLEEILQQASKRKSQKQMKTEPVQGVSKRRRGYRGHEDDHHGPCV